MKRFAMALACILLSGAAGKPEIKSFRIYGIGNDSCASWLSSRPTLEEGTAWIMGFWSGLNAFDTRNHLVGVTTDGPAIVAETKLVCEKEPSTILKEATGLVYYRFLHEGK